MASLSNDGGLRRILVFTPRGKREAIRLGRMPEKQALGILRHVERLAASAIDCSAPPEETSRWLAGIDAKLRERLVKLELAAAPQQQVEALTLGNLIAEYKSRPGWKALKASTIDNKLIAFKAATAHFGDDRSIEEITVAACRDFYEALRLPKDKGGFGLAVATSNTVCAGMHALFSYAIDDERLDRNPFKKIPRGARKGANAHVSPQVARLVLDGIPDTEGKLLFALCRWGGLRTPSEPRGLRFCDIDRERERFLVHSPKTERHEGRESRWVPIFPELRPLIQKRYDEAEPGEVYLLPMMHAAIRSRPWNMLAKVLRHLGVQPWPRLWHSLRATRQTELAETFPAHVVNAWLGNTAAVADRHYLMTLDHHFEQAAQNAAQTVTATPRQAETTQRGEVSDALDSRSVAEAVASGPMR